MRDGEDKLIRRSYWFDLSDRSVVLIMTQGIGTRLTGDESGTTSLISGGRT